MSRTTDIDQAEVEFRDHCYRYDASSLVYAADSALIEQMARKVAAFAASMAADIKALNARDNPNPTPAADIAQLVAEAVMRDMSAEAARLLDANVAYLVEKEGA